MPKESRIPNSIRLGVRVSLQDKEYLERMAKEDDRSISYFIRKLIRAAAEEDAHQRTLNKS